MALDRYGYLPDEGDVVVVHLISNTTLVAKAMFSDESMIELYRAAELAPMRKPDGSIGYGMQPYLSLAGLLQPPEMITFKKKYSVVFIREATKAIEDSWLQLTSGIQVAKDVPKGIIQT